MIAAPRLTVVIVSTRGGALLDETFSTVAGQAAGDMEIIVAARRAPAAAFDPRASRATVRVIRMEDDASIPELYAAGLQAAGGTIVAVTSDRFVPAADWIAAILQAHRDHPEAAVIGGAVVRPATDGLIERAVYHCEYAQFGGSVPAGPCRAPGPNVSYTGPALTELATLSKDPAWEVFWHQHLNRRGIAMARDARIRVRYRCPSTLPGFLRERYLFSRCLAGERMREATKGARMVRGLASLVLPPVLLARLWRRLGETGDSRAWTIAPLLALFTIPWACGEVVGSLWGAGGAARQVE